MQRFASVKPLPILERSSLSFCHSWVVIFTLIRLSFAFLLSLANSNNCSPVSLLIAISVLYLWVGSPPTVRLWALPPISIYVDISVSHIIKKPTRVLLGYFLHKLTHKCVCRFRFGGGDLWIVFNTEVYRIKKATPVRRWLCKCSSSLLWKWVDLRT